VLLLTAPETPLLFMGQEWAAGTPFQYFTDHEPELGRKVTEGRRREFSAFTAFAATGDDTGGLPDPQDDATFAESRLDWTELEREPHASIRRLYAAVLALRGREPALRRSTGTSFDAVALDEDTVAVRRVAEGDAIVVVARLRGAGAVALEPVAGGVAADADWRCLLTTEDARFSAEPEPPVLHLGARPPRIGFSRPGAVVIGARGLHGGTRAGARP
jgi:maltooligosyltrehalose trehalohydrolase